MLKIYISPYCSSCKKVREFFSSLHIHYKEINILSGELTKEDIYEILTKSDYGCDEIISTRSKLMKEKHIDINKMKVSELVNFILQNPSIMKRPIIVDDHKIQVGYDNDELTAFLPIKYRKLFEKICDNCPYYNVCKINDYLKKEATKQICDNKCKS